MGLFTEIVVFAHNRLDFFGKTLENLLLWPCPLHVYREFQMDSIGTLNFTLALVGNRLSIIGKNMKHKSTRAQEKFRVHIRIQLDTLGFLVKHKSTRAQENFLHCVLNSI